MQDRINYDTAVIAPVFCRDGRKTRVRFGANLSMRRGTVLAEKNASLGTFWPYVPGRNDGLSTPKGLLECDCATDGNGLCYIGATTIFACPVGYATVDTTMWTAGTFKCEEIVGLDPAGAAILGRVTEGTLQQGLFALK